MIGDEFLDTGRNLVALIQQDTNIFILLGVIGAGLSVIAWASFLGGAIKLVRMLRQAQPDHTRTRHPLHRLYHMLVEFIAHTRMMRRRTVGIAHWFVMIGFLLGSIVWFEAYIQIFNPAGGWPWLHYQPWYHALDELLGLTTVIFGIILATIRQLHNPGIIGSNRKSRFYHSNKVAAYFVEAVVIIEGLGMLLVKAGQIATYPQYGGGNQATDWVSMWIAKLLPASPLMVSLFAMLKLLTGMVWLFVVGRNLRWGVAWHRFAAFFNIFLKREYDGRSAQRTLRPMTTTVMVPKNPKKPDGKKKRVIKQLTLDNVDPEVDKLGVGRIDQFTWKDWLDFSVCTECGRCQDLCPAWNSGKPLNPKTFIMGLRDVAQTASPYLQQARKAGMVDENTGMVADDAFPRLIDLLPDNPRGKKKRDKENLELLSRPLIGLTPEKAAQLNPAQQAARVGIIDEDILWSCTNCGACVDQCPVDIEHLDHVANLRRHQVLEANQYPEKLTTLFRNLETKGNPWGQSPNARETWIDELERETGFRVPVWDKDVHDFAAEGMEYLFWVGCAGAYEDKAKEATKATALLMHLGGIKFCVLGNQETCTGDAARRAGNEFLFQSMRDTNTSLLDEVFGDAPERKIVATCAHCFNTLGNEYEAGYTVLHHSIVLNQLVNRRRLVPTTPVESIATYHDPCYLGRQNHMFSQPRDLANASGIQVREMAQNRERALCCGGGGAQIWMDNNLGERINLMRVDQALDTGATTIATACPFCTIMLDDGVKERGASGHTVAAENARDVEVKDVSLLLLDAIRRNDHLPQAFKPTPLGDIDTDDAEDAFNVSSADDDSPDEIDQQEFLDTVLPEDDDTEDAENDLDEEPPRVIHTVHLGVVGLPLAGVVPRSDGVPTAQAPDGAKFNIIEAPAQEEEPTPEEPTDRVDNTPAGTADTEPAETAETTPDALADATDTAGHVPLIPGLPLARTVKRPDGVPVAIPPGATQQPDAADTSPETAEPTHETADQPATTGKAEGTATRHETATKANTSSTPAELILQGMEPRADGVPVALAPGVSPEAPPPETATIEKPDAPQSEPGEPEAGEPDAAEPSAEQDTDGSSPEQPPLPGLEIRAGINPPTDFTNHK